MITRSVCRPFCRTRPMERVQVITTFCQMSQSASAVGGFCGLRSRGVVQTFFLPRSRLLLKERGWGGLGGSEANKKFVYLKLASNFRPL